MGVSEGKLGAVDLLVQIFWVLVGIYWHIWIDLTCFQRKVCQKKLFGNSTYWCQNVDYRVLWVLVKVSWVFVWTIRENLGVSVEGGHFLVFIDGLFFVGVVQSGC